MRSIAQSRGSDPIATRTFTYNGKPLECRFGLPEADGNSYYCTYEIGWPEGKKSRNVYGVDSVQALFLAMQAAHTDLLMARENNGAVVEHLGMKRLGLPIMDNLKDLDCDD